MSEPTSKPRFRRRQEPSDEKYVPDTFVGPIESNFYCRGWNGKRKKYCRKPAGSGTNHKGVGRCSFHGGNHESRTKSGRWSQLKTKRLGDAVARFMEDPELLDLRANVALLYALLEDWVERHDEFHAALLTWYALYRARTDQNENLRAVVTMLLKGAPPSSQRHLLELSTTLKELLSEARQTVAQIENISGKVPLTEVDRVFSEFTRIVQRYVDDVDTLEKIKDAMLNIRI